MRLLGMSDGRRDPWEKKDPWGGGVGAGGGGAPTAPDLADDRSAKAEWRQPDTSNAWSGNRWNEADWKASNNGSGAASSSAAVGSTESGRYQDAWSSDFIDLVVDGTGVATVTWVGKAYAPEVGRLSDGSLSLMKKVAKVEGGTITWPSGATWTKTGAPAGEAGAAAASSTAGGGWASAAAGAASTGAASAWDSTPAAAPADAWGAATAGAAWGTAAAPGAGTWNAEDDRPRLRQKRQREFSSQQEWCKEHNILPGKSEKELWANEERLFKSTHSGNVDFSLYDSASTNVSGAKSETIPSVDSFDDMFRLFSDEIPVELRNNILRCGFSRPTPVQKYAIPAGLAGRDLMCCAQTGSGKTVAYLIPILASMMKHGKATGALREPFVGPCKPDALILCPTRELCLQIFTEAEKFCHRTPHRVTYVYGAADAKEQIANLARGSDLCVATPGRLWDFVDSQIVDLTEVACLVFDEADRMLQMENGEGLLREIVEKFGMRRKKERQTLMFSATFENSCQTLAQDYLYEYVWVAIGTIGCATSTVAQNFVAVDPVEKYERLYEFICDFLEKRDEGERLLIFTNSKINAKGLDDKLYRNYVDTGSLHGDLKQEEREKNLEKLRKGEIDVMVATDVASRGLDIPCVSQVVNYDVPFNIDVYVQRIGRTGRIGHRGIATTFISVDKAGDWPDLKADQIAVLQQIPVLVSNSGCSATILPDWFTSKVGDLNSWGSKSTTAKESTWGSWSDVQKQADNGASGWAADQRTTADASQGWTAQPASSSSTGWAQPSAAETQGSAAPAAAPAASADVWSSAWQ